MKKFYKGLVILLIIGLVMSVIGFLMGMNLSTLGSIFNDNASYGEMQTYTLDEAIDALDVSLDRRHITYVVTEETTISVTYYAKEDDTWTFSVESGKLSIEQEEPFRLLNSFNYKYVSKDILTMTLYIPSGWIGDLNLESGTGEINLEMVDTETFAAVNLKSGTGSIKVKKIEADTLDMLIGTGDLRLSDTLVRGDLSAHTGTGDLNLTNVEAEDIDLTSGTGDIILTDVIGSMLEADLGTGDFEGTDVTLSGALSVDTSTGEMTLIHIIATTMDLDGGTGNIEMTVSDLDDYHFDLKTGTGKVYIDGVDQSRIYVGGTGSIDVTAEIGTGRIRVIVG